MNRELLNPIQFEKLPKVGYMRLHQVLKLIPVSKSTWWAGCKTGRFPKPYKLGPRTTGWRVKDVYKCLGSFETSN